MNEIVTITAKHSDGRGSPLTRLPGEGAEALGSHSTSEFAGHCSTLTDSNAIIFLSWLSRFVRPVSEVYYSGIGGAAWAPAKKPPSSAFFEQSAGTKYPIREAHPAAQTDSQTQSSLDSMLHHDSDCRVALGNHR